MGAQCLQGRVLRSAVLTALVVLVATSCGGSKGSAALSSSDATLIAGVVTRDWPKLQRDLVFSGGSFNTALNLCSSVRGLFGPPTRAAAGLPTERQLSLFENVWMLRNYAGPYRNFRRMLVSLHLHNPGVRQMLLTATRDIDRTLTSLASKDYDVCRGLTLWKAHRFRSDYPIAKVLGVGAFFTNKGRPIGKNVLRDQTEIADVSAELRAAGVAAATVTRFRDLADPLYGLG